MSETVFDRLRAELDQLGDSVQRGLEQGRLRIEKARLTAHRDALARELGLLAWQKIRGHDIDEARHESLLGRLDKVAEEIARIERNLASTKGETVSVGEDPPPPTEPAEDPEVTPTQ